MRNFFGVSLLSMCLLVLLGSCGLQDSSKPAYEVKWLWTDMMYPVPYETYSTNNVLPDGLTLQNPVPGTVHREAFVVENPGSNPVPFTKEVLLEGGKLYQTACSHCHGAQGMGDGPVSAKLMKPPAYNSERIMGLSGSDIFDVITKGKGAMAAHASQVTPIERWKIVHYIQKNLQGKH